MELQNLSCLRVAQEALPSKNEALSSNPSTTKRKKNKQKTFWGFLLTSGPKLPTLTYRNQLGHPPSMVPHPPLQLQFPPPP
jgi:hypothetical protein